jgi:8-oxo-dGTP pyrophosphatase MutT (NUDIX family)
MTPTANEALTVPVRRSARLIVLNPHDQVLLFQFEDASIREPAHPRGANQPAIFWCTPGGGLDPGESYEQAAHRELREETGFRVENLGTPIFDEEKLVHINGEPRLHRNRYYLIRVPSSEISLDEFTSLEVSVYRAHRWWTVEELESTREDVFPTELPALVREALQQAPSAIDLPEQPRGRPHA